MSNPGRKSHGIPGQDLLLIFAALLLAACSAVGLGNPGTPTPSPTPAEAAQAISVEGRVVPRLTANLATAASGQVTELLVKEGDTVQAGDVILRLGDQEQYQASIAAAEMAVLGAQQELDELNKNAGLELAQARLALAQANQERTKIEDEYKNLSEPVPQADLDQAYASVVAAKQRLDKATDNLKRYEKRSQNKVNPWQGLSPKEFRDLLDNLRTARDLAQNSYDDKLDRYNDLLNHPDQIKLAQARADLDHIQARIAEAERNIADLRNGPDPDKVAAAHASLNAAQTSLTAAQSALKNSELVAPLPGEIADLTIHAGEWVEANQQVVVLADLSQWKIETDDLTELDVPSVSPGQTVTVRADALPEVELKGVVEAIKGIFEEKRGDVTYTVTIRLDQVDPRLRWGMTVSVDFAQ